ncbi:MAG: TonB-dependent receptor, partial [Proteiniphilum sp.]|nr:TonB-dependent receptor [Proteiniphilum sp.]
MKQKLWALLLSLCIIPLAFAQTASEVSGRITDELTGQAVSDVTVRLLHNNISTTTNTDGYFSFSNVAIGDDVLIISSARISNTEIPVKITTEILFDLGTITVNQKHGQDLALVGIVDESLLSMDDNEGLSQDVSPMVIFSNDIFLRNAGFQFSQFRFRTRGYESRFEERYINGVNFNDQIRGMFNYSSVGALNDITRNGDATNYFDPSSYSFGSIGGSENINMRAGNYARGGKLTLSLTNRNYYARAMATYSTGLRDDGWAVTASIGSRYSHEGHIEGTFYRNVSYALGVEKQWDNGRHSLSFMTFGSPVERGQQGSSYQEVYDLMNNNLYNPNWGYQNGKKRNSKVVKSFDPTGILSHVWKINELTTLTTGFGAHYSRYGGSALNWYDGPDPRPDYYRYLPSYYKDSPITQDYYTYLWKNKDVSQVNWDNMWQANHLNNLEGDGSAIYMVEERRKDLFEMSLNSTLNTQISDRVKLTAGIGLKNSLSKQFKTVDDLLGAQYLLDIDKFAERDFPGNTQTVQNDLRRPNRKVYEGDVFGYDFRFRVNSADIWVQQEHSYRTIDFYYGAKLKYTGLEREGLMQNGRYPDNSYGKGKRHDFMDYGMKTGLTYKFNGRHFLRGNISYQTAAPLVDVAYVSPRITDFTADNLKSMGVFSADLSYIFSLPSVTGRVSVFNTNFNDDMLRVSYYHDSERTFVNHVLSGVNKTHRGIELGLNY